MRYLLESCAVSAGCADASGFTPLVAASQSGHLACVRLLLLRRGVANLGPNAYRDSLTGVAMAGGPVCVLHELLRVDGGAHVRGAKTSKLMTALHFSAGYCHPRVTSLLLAAGADETAVDRSGETPLDVVDTMRAPARIQHGVGRRRIRHMLMRGPAYRALSLRWPASVVPSGAPPSSPSPSTGVAVVTAAVAKAVGDNSATGCDAAGSDWEDSERGFDEAFALAAAAAAWRPGLTVFRRPANADGSPVDGRAAFVARLVR